MLGARHRHAAADEDNDDAGEKAVVVGAATMAAAKAADASEIFILVYQYLPISLLWCGLLGARRPSAAMNK